MKDKIGQEIRPGAYILYAVKDRYSPMLKMGRVLEIKKDKIKVQGVSEWHYPDGPEYELEKRAGTLQFPDRIVVIDRLQVPKEYRRLLDNLDKKPDEEQEQADMLRKMEEAKKVAGHISRAVLGKEIEEPKKVAPHVFWDWETDR